MVSVVTGVQAVQSAVQIPPDATDFFPSQKHEDRLWSLNVYRRFFPCGQMNLGIEAGCSRACSATVKNKCSYASISHICPHCMESKTTFYLMYIGPCIIVIVEE